MFPAQKKNCAGRVSFISLVIVLVIAGTLFFVFTRDFTPDQPFVYGVTFSSKYATELGLDWREAYLAILDDLVVDHVRLVAYWDEVESVIDSFNFEGIDWQLAEAEKRGVNVVLTFGRRTPRWPECHDPDWLAALAPAAIEEQQLEYIRAIVERYRQSQAIKYWQVENEPLFSWFGQCPKINKDFLAYEIELVRLLDSRPVIVTDSGELNHWQGAGRLADVLGVTLYRIVWNEHFGFWDYFFVPPAAYRWKADITKYFHPNLKEVIVTELQMEPWTMNRSMVDLSLSEQRRSFDLERFRSNLDYTRRAGFSEMYFWGVEYWYWLKGQGYAELWEEAKGLWHISNDEP